VQSGDVETSVQALLRDGDQALEWHDWRDALRFYNEAQSLLLDGDAGPLRAVVFERLGDLHLLVAREPHIGMGYYEAALQGADTPDKKVRLMCRVAHCWRSLDVNRFQRYLRQADALAGHGAGPVSESWVNCLKAAEALSVNDQHMTHQLIDKTMATESQLPQDMRLFARRIVCQPAGLERRVEDIQSYEHQTDVRDRSLGAGIHWSNIANAYDLAGDFDKALSSCQTALTIFEGLQQSQLAANMVVSIGSNRMKTGHYAESRALYMRAAEDPSASDQLRMVVYRWLCMLAAFDNHAQADKDARCMLESWLNFQFSYPSSNEGRLFYNLQLLGPVEQVLLERGQRVFFAEWLDRARQKLKKAGFRAEGIWSLRETRDLAEIGVEEDLNGWQWVPGCDESVCDRRDGLTMRAPPVRGFFRMDMPRLVRPVEGDFVLQAGLPATRAVQRDLKRCYDLASHGQRSEGALGGGGLLLLRNKRDALRILVHLRRPGDVICTMRQGEEDQLLGRGVLPDDGPVRLRLERRGNLVSAYAATGEKWLAPVWRDRAGGLGRYTGGNLRRVCGRPLQAY
jgi:tetratricopeptide (TPR) repeat protein